MHDREVYAVVEMPAFEPETTLSDTAELARPEPPQPGLIPAPMPDAPVTPTGTLQAGIRAYESKDYTRAYQVWEPLAEAGQAGAQFHLGALYFEGRGVGRDLSQARRWLRQALAQGEERARFLLGRVETQLAKAG